MSRTSCAGVPGCPAGRGGSRSPHARSAGTHGAPLRVARRLRCRAAYPSAGRRIPRPALGSCSGVGCGTVRGEPQHHGLVCLWSTVLYREERARREEYAVRLRRSMRVCATTRSGRVINRCGPRTPCTDASPRPPDERVAARTRRAQLPGRRVGATGRSPCAGRAERRDGCCAWRAVGARAYRTWVADGAHMARAAPARADRARCTAAGHGLPSGSPGARGERGPLLFGRRLAR